MQFDANWFQLFKLQTFWCPTLWQNLLVYMLACQLFGKLFRIAKLQANKSSSSTKIKKKMKNKVKISAAKNQRLNLKPKREKSIRLTPATRRSKNCGNNEVCFSQLQFQPAALTPRPARKPLPHKLLELPPHCTCRLCSGATFESDLMSLLLSCCLLLLYPINING